MQPNLRRGDQKKREDKTDGKTETNNSEVEERVCVGVKERQRERARRSCFYSVADTSGWKQPIRDFKKCIKRKKKKKLAIIQRLSDQAGPFPLSHP